MESALLASQALITCDENEVFCLATMSKICRPSRSVHGKRLSYGYRCTSATRQFRNNYAFEYLLPVINAPFWNRVKWFLCLSMFLSRMLYKNTTNILFRFTTWSVFTCLETIKITTAWWIKTVEEQNSWILIWGLHTFSDGYHECNLEFNQLYCKTFT